MQQPPYGNDQHHAYGRSAERVLSDLNVERTRGLPDREVRRRRRAFGANRLRTARRKTTWAILADQFKSLVVMLLLAAAGTAAAFGEIVEAAAIGAALIINAVVGFWTEQGAVRSMDALRRIGQVAARVRRGGGEHRVRAEELVPGDIVLLREGDVVAADVRLIEVENLQINEAALTGESVPVDKSPEPLEHERVPLAERSNMAFRGTAVARGAAEGVVVGIGGATEIGRIADLAEGAEDEQTPLERRLDRLGHRLIFLVLGVGVAVAAAGIAAGQELFIMIETAIVLAIAAVPEGLPIVSTVCLGRGMWRMSRHNALVKRLSAVETLGATTVILTDKTGTLTENRMVLRRVVLGDGEVDVGQTGGGRFRAGEELVDPNERPALLNALRIGALCNNVETADDEGHAHGDPMEAALVEGAAAAGLNSHELLGELPEVREESFDTETKMMATVHRSGGQYLVAVKGAPEAVLDAATKVRIAAREEALDAAGRDTWRTRNEALAAAGLRVLAVAEKTVEDPDAAPYQGLTLLGLVGLYDPPRTAVADAIRACRNAGVRVVMVTGDQAATATNVAREVGIVTGSAAPDVIEGRDLDNAGAERIGAVSVFARVSPEDKLKLVEALQDAGEVVGMTGDGVNDAPALGKADIGIAMGRRGTDVAREAGDIVLKDDAFETIVMAIRQGRTIFTNIRKFIVFLLSGNLGQIIAISLAALAGAPLPLLPLQILYLNLLLDVFPALALGVGGDEPGVMNRPPRDPGEAIVTREHWLAITGFGIAIGASVLAAFTYAIVVLEATTAAAVTVAFLTYAFARLWHLFNMRSPASSPLRNDVTRNPYVWGAVVLCTALILAALYLPPLAALLELSPPGAAHWGVVAVGSLLPLGLGQAGIEWVRVRAAGVRHAHTASSV